VLLVFLLCLHDEVNKDKPLPTVTNDIEIFKNLCNFLNENETCTEGEEA
jgi:hypothetical protein